MATALKGSLIPSSLMMPNKNRRPTLEEELLNDEIDREYEDWSDVMFGIPVGYVPNNILAEMDEKVLAAYTGVPPNAVTECSTASTSEEWREFLRKIEEDLDG